MYKQAYLIIAHKYDETLKILLQMLDKEENDIYIHMDKKNKEFNKRECERIFKKAGIFFTERTNVKWGGYSQINAELILMETASLNRKYDYYHLLSGQDLPIKSSEYIKKFFINNYGKEFVGFDKLEFNDYSRVQYYYPLQEMVARDRRSFVGRISAILTFIQKIIHLKRNKNIVFQKGPNWFSITDDLVRYVIEKKYWIKKVFYKSICCDEVFLQTIIINSSYKDRVFNYAMTENTEEAAMRLVDWKRGGPYVFRKKDYDQLINSSMLFARKFDYEQDMDVIKLIYKINDEEI